MGGRKIVQDSDEESNHEGSPPPTDTAGLELSLSPIINLQYSSPPKILDQSGQASIVSTGSIREIRDALRDPAEQRSDDRSPSRRSSQQPQASPKVPPESNRRATTAFAEHREKRPLKTYGTKGSQDRPRFPGYSDDEGDFRPHKKSKANHVSEVTEGGSSNRTQNGNVGNDPTASRVEAMLNNYHGTEEFLTSNWSLGSFPSIHTSVQASTTPKTPKGSGASGSLRSQQSTIRTVADGTPAASTAAHTTGSTESNASNDTIPEPSLSLHGPKEMLDATCEKPALEEPFSNKHSRTQLQTSDGDGDRGTAPPASQTSVQSDSRHKSLDNSDELASPNAKPPASTAKRGPSNTSTGPEGKSTNHSDELGADDLTFGLPKEQYQPRPSRSRSTRNDEGLVIPEDFSKRPETLGKKKKASKRRKTTALAKPSPKVEIDDEDDEDEDIIVPPRRTTQKPNKEVEPVVLVPSEAGQQDEEQPKEAQQQRGMDQLEAPVVDKEPIEEEVQSPEKVPPSSPSKKKKRGRPRKPTTEQVAASEPPNEDHALPTDNDDDHPEPPDLATGGRKGGNPTPNIPETKTDQQTKDSGPVPTKRGRKRKTNDNATPSVLADENAQEHNATENPPILDEDPDPPLSQSHGNRQPPPSKNATKTADPAALTTPPKTPQKPTGQQQPSVSAAKGPDKHSPLNSSKVKFRVGLSKRARIEPLLKVVRK